MCSHCYQLLTHLCKVTWRSMAVEFFQHILDKVCILHLETISTSNKRITMRFFILHIPRTRWYLVVVFQANSIPHKEGHPCLTIRKITFNLEANL